MSDNTKINKAKIVLEGVDECIEDIRTIKSEMQELNNCIQQLTKSMEKLGKLFGRKDYSDASSTSTLQ